MLIDILPEDFKKLNTEVIENYNITGVLHLDNQKSYQVKNCSFQDGLYISSGGRHNYEFVDSKISSLMIANATINSLELKGCTMHTLEFAGSNSAKSVHIQWCEHIEIIQIGRETSLNNLRIDSGSVILFKSEANLIGDTVFDRTNFNEIKATNGNLDKLQLRQISAETVQLELADGEKLKSTAIIITQSTIDTFNLIDMSLNGLFIFGGNLSRINLRPSEAKHIEVNQAPESENPNFRLAEIGRLNIHPWAGISDTKFIISNIQSIRVLALRDVTYFKEAYFDNVKIEQEFNAKNTSFIRCRFNRIQFEPECNVDMYRTYLQGSDFVNVTWPRRHRIVEDLQDSRSKKSIREAYRQLKKVSLDQNNKIEALEFQKNEMRIHHRIAADEKWNGFTAFGNYFIVATHNWFSDFGQNIWKPFLLLFIVHWLLFFGYLCLFMEMQLTISPSNTDWPLTAQAYNNYFNTLLPTHSNEITFDDKELPKKLPGTLDFTMRLCSGYFIFYFIYVSRKYHQ